MNEKAQPLKKDWKYYLGVVLFIYGLVPYEIALMLPLLGLPGSLTASLAAGVIITGEISFFTSVALLGKPFIETLKAKFHQIFVRRGPPPPLKPVSRRRHNVGVALFFGSFLPYFAAEALLMLGRTGPRQVQGIIGLLLLSDATFLVSLFVLGGEFWAKLKKLFEWQEAAG